MKGIANRQKRIVRAQENIQKRLLDRQKLRNELPRAKKKRKKP